jgi:hypothetical protein
VAEHHHPVGSTPHGFRHDQRLRQSSFLAVYIAEGHCQWHQKKRNQIERVGAC